MKKQEISDSILSLLINRKEYVLIIFLVSFVVFFKTFGNNFVFDDHSIVDQNYSIRNPANIPHFFISSYWPRSMGGDEKGLYRPVVVTSFAIDYFIWKLKPIGYHITNYIFHSLNAILVFLLFSTIFKKATSLEDDRYCFPAIAASLIFLVHPVHIEAVSGIVGRAEIFSAFFLMASLLLYIKGERIRNYYISLCLFMLALLSKETAIVLPVFIILYDVFYNQPVKQDKVKGLIKRAPYYYGYIIVMVLYIAVRISVLSGISPKGSSKVFYLKSLSTKVYTMAVVFSEYLKLMFYPIGLSPEKRDFPMFNDLLNIKVIIGLFLIGLVVYLVVFLIKKNRDIAYSLLWFLVALFPVSNIIPIGILIADRLLYLPSVGFSFLMAMPFFIVGKKSKSVLVLVLLAVLFSAITIKRSFDWKDDITLWEHTVKRFPDNYVARNSLGALYYLSGNYDRSIDEYKEALTSKPDYTEAWNNLGFSYKGKGLYKEAVEAHNKTIEIDSGYASAYNALGYLHYQQGDYGLAEAEYKKAIEVDPGLEEAHNNLALLYHAKKMYNEAIAGYKKSVEINPDYENGHYNLANIYFETGAYSDSVAEFKKVENINPEKVEVYKDIGLIYYGKLTDYKNALIYLRKYLELSPGAADAELIRKIIAGIINK